MTQIHPTSIATAKPCRPSKQLYVTNLAYLLSLAHTFRYPRLDLGPGFVHGQQPGFSSALDQLIRLPHKRSRHKPRVLLFDFCVPDVCTDLKNLRLDLDRETKEREADGAGADVHLRDALSRTLPCWNQAERAPASPLSARHICTRVTQTRLSVTKCALLIAGVPTPHHTYDLTCTHLFSIS